jgi:hypothetical protein
MLVDLYSNHTIAHLGHRQKSSKSTENHVTGAPAATQRPRASPRRGAGTYVLSRATRRSLPTNLHWKGIWMYTKASGTCVNSVATIFPQFSMLGDINEIIAKPQRVSSSTFVRNAVRSSRAICLCMAIWSRRMSEATKSKHLHNVRALIVVVCSRKMTTQRSTSP